MNPQKLAADARGYVDSLRLRFDTLEAERVALASEGEALLSAPLAIEDVKQFVCDYIDRRAQQFPKDSGWPAKFERLLYPFRYEDHTTQGARADRALRKPLCLRDMDAALADPGTAFDGHPLNFYGAAENATAYSDAAAYFFFGDIIKARVLEQFDTLGVAYLAADAKHIGPHIPERRARLAVIEKRTLQITDEQAEIRAELDDITASAQVQVSQAHDKSTKPQGNTRPSVSDREIYSRYDGKNADELAREFEIPIARVHAVAAGSTAPAEFD